MNIDGVGI